LFILGRQYRTIASRSIVKSSGQAVECSIVIPLLNQNDQWLKHSVISALQQTTACEVIVVISAKTPQSNLDVLRSLRESSKNLILTSSDSEGFPVALNAGFQTASTDRVGMLMSDDWLDPRAAELCVAQNADIVSTGHTFFAADGVTPFHEIDWTPTWERYEGLQTLERKASYLKHFLLIRKSMLEEIGGADESLGNFPGIDDYDMIWTLLEHRATVALVAESLYNIRDHGSGRLTLKNAQESIRGLERILRKHGIGDDEAPGIIQRHSRWYGMPVNEAYRKINAGKHSLASDKASRVRGGSV
jgi:glycosyltransferase involved in cell wall biosynthesis